MAEPRPPASAVDSGVFARARELFESALDWPPAERDDRLTQACVGDTSLRVMIDRMLQADATPHRLLDCKLLLALARLEPGDTIGTHLEIVALIGSGGMGEVYRAHDSSLGRDVAIKVLRWTAAVDVDAEGERLEQLRREAHVLAALNHPNIAVIHAIEEWPACEGGTTDVVALVLELGGVHTDDVEHVVVSLLERAQLIEDVQAVDAAERPEV